MIAPAAPPLSSLTTHEQAYDASPSLFRIAPLRIHLRISPHAQTLCPPPSLRPPESRPDSSIRRHKPPSSRAWDRRRFSRLSSRARCSADLAVAASSSKAPPRSCNTRPACPTRACKLRCPTPRSWRESRDRRSMCSRNWHRRTLLEMSPHTQTSDKWSLHKQHKNVALSSA